MKYDYSVIEEKFKQLPKELQRVLSSSEISDTVAGISQKNDLKIDQEGVLFDLVTYVILGLLPSKDFLATFSKDAEVDRKVAQIIVSDINTLVLKDIQSAMKIEAEMIESQTPSADTTIADIERMGGISIDPHPPAPPAHTEEQGTSASDRARLMYHFEKSVEDAPKKQASIQQNFTEPLIDHLLSTPRGMPEQKSTPVSSPIYPLPSTPKPSSDPKPVSTSSTTPPPPLPPQNNTFTGPLSEKTKPDGGKPAFDPYRELIK
jgi:hypothetical protein